MSAEPRTTTVVRPIAPHEFERVGDLVERAYRVAGHLEKDHGYDVVLRDVADRARCGPVLVATSAHDETAIVGSVTICPPGTLYAEIARSDETELRFLAVEPAATRQGIARTLVDAVIEYARGADHRAVVLSVIDWNEPGLRLYDAMGFTRVPARDWTPVPDIRLLAFELEL